MANVNPIPGGLHTITASLTIKNCADALEFYKRAFGAEERSRFLAPDGTSVWHAELRIGDSTLFVSEEMPQAPARAPERERPSPAGLWLYVHDCDAAFRRAVGAGANVTMELADQFWGDRVGAVVDPYGYVWTFASRIREMTPDEMRKAGETFAKTLAQGGAGS
jgi:PhnB protein